MYRSRFEERRHATEALDALFSEASAARDSDTRAWLIAVAHHRIPSFRDRLTRDGARDVLSKVEDLALTYAGRGGIHSLESVDQLNPRPASKLLANTVGPALTSGNRLVGRRVHVEVVRLLSQGRSNPEIAQHLLMSRSTVKAHLTQIYARLDVANRTELAALATPYLTEQDS